MSFAIAAGEVPQVTLSSLLCGISCQYEKMKYSRNRNEKLTILEKLALFIKTKFPRSKRA